MRTRRPHPGRVTRSVRDVRRLAASREGHGGAMDGVVDRGVRSGPESYTWPLLTVVLVIVPQVLIPPAHRVGPPLLVPIVEGIALVVLLAIAAKPGPVPRSARSLVLALFGLLVLANAVAAVRL